MKHAGPIGASMQRKLETNLAPLVLNIVNESHKHAGHAGNPGGGPDAETHFRRGANRVRGGVEGHGGGGGGENLRSWSADGLPARRLAA